MTALLKQRGPARTVPRPKYGPADDGKPITEELATIALWEPGYRYEIIHGRISVCPVPSYPHSLICLWLQQKLEDYSEEHPEVFKKVFLTGRVFLPVPDTTVPEPDISAFKANVTARDRDVGGTGKISSLCWR